MKFGKYLALATHPSRPPTSRRGQHAFNVLHAHRPDIAEHLRGTHLDPFYDDDRLPAFFVYVKRAWK